MQSSVSRSLLLAFISALLLSGCAGEPASTGSDQSSPSTSSDTKAMNDTSNPQLAPPAAGDKIAIIETGYGTIKVRLFSEQAPEITKNFEELAKAGKYSGTPFHRVMKDFMIQTGDFTKGDGTGGHSYKGPGTELDDEIVPGLKHLYGTVSMANHGPNTNGSQFFIVTNKNGTPFLDGGYSIFGQVYEGMDVVHRIEALQMPRTEKPSEIVTMTSVTVMTYQPE